MIYYPLGAVMLAGIRDILIISTLEDLPRFEAILGDGGAYEILLHYAEQAAPKGLVEAYVIGCDLNGGDLVALILGDKIFYGAGLVELLWEPATRGDGATVFVWAGGARTGVGQTYYLAGSGLASWRGLASVAMANCRRLGLAYAEVRPLVGADWPTPVPRPRNGALDSGRLAADFGFAMSDWRTSVTNVVERLAESAAARA